MAATTTKLFFIRHGEKPKGGKIMNGLNEKGERRRAALPKLLERAVETKKFDGVFSVQPAKKIPKHEKFPKRARPSLTVQCISPKATLFPRGNKLEDMGGDREAWLQSLTELEVYKKLLQLLEPGTSGNYLICWEHHIEAAFIDLLWKEKCGGGNNFHPKGPLKWPSHDFDTIVVYDGAKNEFSREFQHFEAANDPSEMTGHDWNLPPYSP